MGHPLPDEVKHLEEKNIYFWKLSKSTNIIKIKSTNIIKIKSTNIIKIKSTNIIKINRHYQNQPTLSKLILIFAKN